MSFDALIEKYPSLSECLPDIKKAFSLICQTYDGGGRVYVCGNGGSEADAKHIVGELMKGFMKRRPVRFPAELRKKLSPETVELFEDKLQGALPCHALSGETALITAVVNDTDPRLIFAQQIYGYGRPGDCFIGISTSGNAADVCLAAELARAMGLSTIALTGRGGGKLAGLCDAAVRVPADTTPDVQELHLPVYHALCAEAEAQYFGE